VLAGRTGLEVPAWPAMVHDGWRGHQDGVPATKFGKFGRFGRGYVSYGNAGIII